MLVYTTNTNMMTPRFTDKLSKVTGLDVMKMSKVKVDSIDKDFILITCSIGRGQTPVEVLNFLEYGDNSKYLKAVIGTGDKVWGNSFCKGASRVAEMYGVPLLHKVEKQGFQKDLDIVLNKLDELRLLDRGKEVNN